MERQRYSAAAATAARGGRSTCRDLLGPDLGDLPVLAELAVDVAARRGERKGVRSRAGRWKKGFFSIGIDVERAGLAVDQRVIGSAVVLAGRRSSRAPCRPGGICGGRARTRLSRSGSFL